MKLRRLRSPSPSRLASFGDINVLDNSQADAVAEGLISRADHVGRRHVLMGRGGVDGNQSTDDPF